MAKGVISKGKKAPSVRSRAARRETSPSIDTDKSLKNVQAPPESVDHRPSILSLHHGAGVSKKTKQGRNMSSKARKRHEKGQDRAIAILERTQQKVAKSKGQARTIQSRRKAWDDINNHIPATTRKSTGEKDNDEENQEEEESEFDDEMDEAADGKRAGTAVVAGTEPLPSGMDQDNDGIM